MRQKIISILGALTLFGVIALLQPLGTAAQAFSSMYYTFNNPGVLSESSTMAQSTSPYLWLLSGGRMIVTTGGIGETIQGDLLANDRLYRVYSARSAVSSDNGAHPQNVFKMFGRDSVQNPSAQIYINRIKDNTSNPVNRRPYDGESLLARYQDVNNYYYGGLREDGGIVIKKKTNGVFQTLVSKQLFAGAYNSATNPDLIPRNQWIGLKFVVDSTHSTNPMISLYTDVGQTGTWQLALSVVDDPVKYGNAITNAGLVGIESDYADAQFDNLLISEVSATTPAPVPTPSPTPTPTPSPTPANYDSVILGAHPVMYLAMSSPGSGSEQDKSGNGNNGSYKGGTPLVASLPNGDSAADFNGSTQYLTVPSSAALSIPTTHQLTYEAWIRPDTWQFANASGDGYVDWMGKCQDYSPTCEWEARIYSTITPEDRPDRMSAYAFNPSAGLGSAADWQPIAGLFKAGQWIHVVAEYQTLTTPSGCSSATPGSIDVWINGIKQSLANHIPTGCMSQYNISPQSSTSPLNIGTMAMDTWFSGAVGKVAVYDHVLSQSEIDAHFKAMTGKDPSGSCAETCTAVTVN